MRISSVFLHGGQALDDFVDQFAELVCEILAEELAREEQRQAAVAGGTLAAPTPGEAPASGSAGIRMEVNLCDE